MRTLRTFKKKDVTVEFRYGISGYSIDLNQKQIFWSDYKDEAMRLFIKMTDALDQPTPKIALTTD